MTQDLKYVPFDLRQFRCIVYEQSITGSKLLRKKLVKTFEEVAKHLFRLKVKEHRITPFDKKLVGYDNNLYQIQIEVPHIGYGAVKMIIHFTQISIDKPSQEINTQFLFVSQDFPTRNIENIPWIVSFIQANDKDAIISLDKD